MNKLSLGLILFSLLLSGSVRADNPLEMIELKHRPVAEVLPLVRPFVDKAGSISGMNNLLVIRTSPQNLNEIRQIVRRIDTPLKRLMIYVRQGRAEMAVHSGVSAGFHTSINDRGRILAGDAPGREGARLTIRSAHTQSRQDITHRVQTLEGHSAFIETGQSIPINTISSTTNSSGSTSQQVTTRYRNATTGFYVTPRLSGEQVTLEVRPHMNRPDRVSGAFDIQRASTVVTTRLGQWVLIGGSSGGDTPSASGPLHQYRTENKESSSIYLMVEEIAP